PVSAPKPAILPSADAVVAPIQSNGRGTLASTWRKPISSRATRATKLSIVAPSAAAHRPGAIQNNCRLTEW
ncbi:hypothetical protein FCO27_19305, partial [Bacillus pumilus]